MPKKPNPSKPRRASSAFTIRFGAVAISVSLPLSSAATESGIISARGEAPVPWQSRSTIGMKIATTAVPLMKAPRPAAASISITSARPSWPPVVWPIQSPIRRATPVRTRPSPMTKSAAINTMLGSAKPASASDMVRTPVKGSSTIISSPTTSMRGRLATNITIAAASRSRTRRRSVFMGRNLGGRRCARKCLAGRAWASRNTSARLPLARPARRCTAAGS